MVTAEELLYGVSAVDKTLIISNDLRTIAIPSSVKNLGVESDDDVLRLNFKMPRYIGDVDLSVFSIRINYLNAEGEGDIYTVSDAVSGSEYITFSWLVGPNATKYKGDTKFNVCMRTFASDGTVDREYNTTIASLSVLEGLEVDESYLESYTDLLEQWRRELFGIGDTEEAKIKAVSQAEQETIVQVGVDVLASIPEDYQTAVSMTKNAERTKADAIICSAQGETISVSDSSDDYLRGLKIFGRTDQINTTGKQLAWTNINVADYPYLGVVCSKTEDDNVLLHGTATSNMWNRLASTDLVAGEKYTLSSNKQVALSVWDVTADSAFTTKPKGTDSVTFIAPNTGSYAICIENTSGTPFAYIRADIMLNAGETALPWEPYSGGYVSPSPEWSQELKSISDPLIGLYGKNLINVDEMELASNKTLTISQDKYTITVVGGSDKTYAYSHYDMPEELVRLVRGRRLRLSSDSISKSVSSAYSPVQLNIKCADGTFQYPVNHDSRLYYEFLIPEDTVEIRFGIYTNNSATVLESDNTVIVTGVRLTLTDNTEYEPYKGYQTLTMPYTLRGISVESGGSYTNTNGQQWIGDEVDLARGVHVQRIGAQTFNNAFEFVNKSSIDGSGVFYCGLAGYDTASYTLGMMSDQFRFAGYDTHNSGAVGHLSSGEFSYIRNTTAGARVYFAVAGITSKEEATAWLAEHQPTIYFSLKTPIETQLTAEEIAAFRFAHSNYPNTTVLNDVGAWMELQYNADTKTWLENKSKVLIDTVTGKSYQLNVVNGKLTLIELEV